MPENEGKTREVRRVQDGVAESAPDSNRERAATASSGRTRGVDVGNAGTNSPWATFGDSLAGGIIGQLISDTEDRINEAAECIAWYQRELEKNQQRLANLRTLEELAKQQQGK